MRAYFCRVGSKSDMVTFLTDIQPVGYTSYIEPFVGSGAFYWSKSDEDIPKIINDLDAHLMWGYNLLQNGNITVAERFNTKDIDRLTTINNYQGTDDSCNLAAIMVTYANTFGGKGTGRVYKSTNPYNKLKKIKLFRENMSTTKLLNTDYINVINLYDNEGAFFFFDPPYVDSSNQMYKHDNIDMLQLHRVLSNLQGKFILTLDNTEGTRTLFKEFRQLFRPVRAKGRVASGGAGSKDRVDLIILNY